MKLSRTSLLVIGTVIVALSSGLLVFHGPTTSLPSRLKQQTSTPPNLALAPGLIPPTNRWFSGLVFSKTPQPVFSYPLAYKPAPSGFVISQPTVVTTANTLTSPITNDISFDAGSELAQTVTAYDDLSVQLGLKKGDRDFGTLRITEGSPYIFLHINKGNSFTLSTNASEPILVVDDHSFLLSIADKHFLISFMPSSYQAVITGTKLSLASRNSKATLSIGALPNIAALNSLRNAALNDITNTEVTYETSESGSLTNYRLTTSNNLPTLYGLLPLQSESLINSQPSTFGFSTLYGNEKLYSGNNYQYSLKGIPPTILNLSKLSPSEKTNVVLKLKSDAQNLKFDAPDTYFGGKQLYRVAMLVQLADELGAYEIRDSLLSQLRPQLETWLDPRSSLSNETHTYYYDSTIKGLVGKKSSFGSELFNDHHFHYGYMIYAASVVASRDKTFAQKYNPMINLIVKDIANSDPKDSRFPTMRVFDRYTGHSWASGFADFADGNNQESSSEATSAWAAVYYWGQVSGDKKIQSAGQYLYDNESGAALKYWLNIDTTQSIYTGYTHSIVDIVWGGKRDYATFFDAKPEAKLAIQILPLSPGDSYVAIDTARVKRNLDQLHSESGSQDFSEFGDYLIMYESITDRAQAIKDISNYDISKIDGANSESYMYAWIYSQK
jgi:endo-1,3(4)-beta-glucanase